MWLRGCSALFWAIRTRNEYRLAHNLIAVLTDNVLSYLQHINLLARI